MNIVKLVEKYNKLNIAFRIEDNELIIESGEGVITDEILKDIRKNKQEIISLLDKKKSPLSFAQERLWFLDQYDHNASYNLPGAVGLIGNLDIDVLEKTFREIIKRHEILRTNFITIDNVTSQLIHKESAFKLQTVDYSLLSEEEANQKIQEQIELEAQKPFDLGNDSLIRLILYKINDKEHTLFLNKHHIISDGWSSSVFLKEISLLYKAFSENEPSPLPELKIQYADYAIWQREHIEGEVLANQTGYWKNKLSDVPILELPTDNPRPAEQTFNGARLHFRLDKDLSEKLNSFSKEKDVTLFMTLLSVFKVLLNKYTGQDDICVGSPIANRTRTEIEPLIGFFVNTLALRSDLSGDTSFLELLEQVKQTTLEAYDNQDIPFEKVVDIVQPERNLSYSPLFQVMLVLQNTPEKELSFGELSLKPVEFEQAVSKFDLTLNFTETDEGIAGGIEYNTDLFDQARIERMMGHLNVLLESIILNPDKRVKDLEILTPEEKHLLLVEWNDTNADYPKDKCIHQIFEGQARKTPENIAVVFENKQLTYRELNGKANQLAHYLQSKGVKPESLVGICVDRSLEMIVGLLGILKAGGAYVPIDPTYPEGRISYMLEDAGCKIVLSQEHLKLPETGSEIIYLDSDWEKIENEPAENVKSEVKSDNLAYVIYTSGSTGRPKGVMIEHAGICNLQKQQVKIFNIDGNDVILQFASLSFDASVSEIFMALSKSAKLVLCKSESLVDVVELTKLINDNKISAVTLPPTLLKLLSSNLPTLKTVISAGEMCTPELVKEWAEEIAFYNAYGPTENTVCASIYKCNINEIDSLSIGKAIANCKLYVLDSNLNLAPIGVAGELCISGDGLARGYLKRPELTAEKFIKNPFSEDSNSRLYKTGDLVRYLPDGNIEFIGRIDTQVKIRGLRIELGEIETELHKTGTIKDCVVVVKEDAGGNEQLVAYLVSDEELKTGEIRDGLSKSLPDYMIPSYFVELDSLPLTPNGKIDRKALPEPEVKAGEDYLAPSSEIEETLVGIWSEVLGIDKNEISINKSFFEIGGNSLLSIRLQQKLHELDEFKGISIADLFKYHTINMLAQSIGTRQLAEYKLQDKKQNRTHEVAIIGMSGAFSGVNNIAEYWQLLENQDEGLRFYSKEECEKLGVDAALLENPNYILVAGSVKDIELFDPLFWDISPNEAKLTDPQIRKFIEHCWLTLESSGYVHQRKEQNIGVFAGSGNGHYFYSNILNGEMALQINVWEALSANNKDALATKTSYLLGLSGPANSINTACSTGLVSVVEACKNLQLGTCDMALAGGVSLAMPNQIGYTYQEGMIKSKDGHCRTFDEDASGTVGGSGVGVVLLKRLEDAIKSNDNIIGVIKGYSSNNDGDRKTGYTAPSVTGQAECIINAQKMAGVSSGEIDYVECHGTATNLGDPIEVQALKEAFEFNRNGKGLNPENKTVLGAVKANIGHVDSAAGTAGLIKACLMLQNNLIPGQPNFNVANPKLNIGQTNFEIAEANKEWLPSSSKQRIAGVSSFGIGGTNAHVIVGDYVPETHNQPGAGLNGSASGEGQDGSVNYVVPVSAKSKLSLKLYREELINYLTGSDLTSLSIRDIAYTLQEKREHFNYRSAYRAKDIEGLIDKLKEHTSFEKVDTELKSKLVFMFPGQGSQYPCMAKELYVNDPFFKTTIDKLILVANRYLDVDLYEVMYPGEGDSQDDINEIRFTPISLFVIEYALAKYLEHLGIEADAYIGHSFGEYVAATLSGVFTLEDAIRVIIARGELMQSMQPGSMLAINANEDTVKAIIKAYNCEISVINSVEDIVASGCDSEIEKLKEVLENQDIPVVKLNSFVAGHSRMMENAAIKFERVFDDIELNKPQKYFVSNLSGEIAGEEVVSARYWCKQLRNTVQFAKGINSLSEKYNYKVRFIELGPGKGLSSFVTKYKNFHSEKTIQSIQLLPSEKEIENNVYENVECIEDILAKLWISGVTERANDLKLLRKANTLTNLPAYQFDFKKCWIEPGSRQSLKKYNPVDDLFYKRSWERMEIPTIPEPTESLKQKNLLVLINDKDIKKSGGLNLIETLSGFCDNTGYVVHKQTNNIVPDFVFDLSDPSHIKKIFNEKIQTSPIDIVIYISSSIDIENSGLDIFAIRNTFDWAVETNNSIPKFVSISFDNYKVIGNEVIQDKPSIVSGVTKSIPFEYFTRDIVTFHIDLSLNDSNYKEALIATILQNEDKELIAIRGEFKWFPTYQHVNLHNSNSAINEGLQSGNPVFLITGGLGGVGYAYADHLTQRDEKCTIILLGRTKESDLRKDYKTRLTNLLETKHRIIYAAIDIGSKDAEYNLKKLFVRNNITEVDVILHAAGIAPVSAINEKTHKDIIQVLEPKIAGVENLVKLAKSIEINYLVCCSSLSSITPSLGNMEYTSGNLYLDELCYRSQHNIKKMLAVNLNQIYNTGMAVKFAKQERSNNSIKSHEFPTILDMILKVGIVNSLSLSRFDINNVLFENKRYLKSMSIKTENRNKSKIDENNYTETEFKIAQIWIQILGIEEIDIYDNFFELGGNSLHATRVISQIRNEFDIELPLKTVFEKPELFSISKVVENTKSEREIPGITARSKGIDLPLSFAQERLWFMDQYRHDNIYNMPRAVKLVGKVDKEVLEKTFTEIIRRHEVLRTNFITIDNVARQLIHEESKLEFITADQSHLPEEEANKKIRELIEIESQKPFDLANDSLIRLILYKINEEEHSLFLNKHHIISDGWSFSVFLKEISILYKAFSENKPSPLPELEIQYADYAVWQREHIEGEVLAKQSEYWKNKLSGTPILELPTDKPRPAEQTFNGANVHFSLDKGLTEKLNFFCKENDVTLFMTLLSVFKVLLNKYTGQDDICIGSPIANRTRTEIEPLIGFFVNTLALRSDLSGDISFMDLVKQVKQTTLDAYDNQDIPFEKVVDIVQPVRDLSYSPLFQVAMALQNNPTSELSFSALSLKPVEFEQTVSKSDLTIEVTETAEGIVGGINYNTDLFDRARIERMVEHFTVLAESILSDHLVTISELEILTSIEKHQLLVKWNDTKADYPKDKCVHQLFEEQVEKTPNNIALVCEKEELTYKQLNEKSNQLAHYLQSKGVKPESLVGICVDRSFDMMVGMLGIMKAGGAYVPIDSSYPEKRISHILEDSGAINVLTSSKTMDKIPFDCLISNSSKYEGLIVTPKCKQIDKLNILPHPDRTLIDYSKYHQKLGNGIAKHTVTIQATRGCPYKCSFCHKIWPKKHIVRDADDIFNEILNCYKAGVSRFAFIDDIFNLDKNNSRLVFEKIISSGIDIQLFFPNGLRGDVLTEDFIDLMVKAGTVHLGLSLESASPRIQKLIKKNLNLEKFKNITKYIINKHPDVVLELAMMIGFPTETEEEALMTLDFLRELKWVHFPNLFILKIYPNTDMYKLAIENGITEEQINSSLELAYHEIPDTIPFSKSFVRQCQADIMNYFLSEERMTHVLKHQFNKFTKDEILKKYDSYLPTSVKNLNDLIELTNIDSNYFEQINYLPEEYRSAPDFNLNIKKYFPQKQKRKDAYKILFIDLSMLFSSDRKNEIFDMSVPPLGLAYLLSYLNQEFGENVNGKIVKSRIDFNNYTELKKIISDFKPDLIGLRSLSIFKDFFHLSVSKIKHWFPHVPIIAGGPYATSDYKYILQDRNIEMVVLGEGELVLAELIKRILANDNEIPDSNELKEIPSLAFIDKEVKLKNLRNIIQIDELNQALNVKPVSNIVSDVKSNGLINVIYTSGSTGTPKGVMVEHKSVVNLVSNQITEFGITEDDKIMQFSSICFDASVEQINLALLAGASLILVNEELLLDKGRFSKFIIKNELTHIHAVPGFINTIEEKKYPTLKRILSGGDVCSDKLIEKWISHCTFINKYGPTETTVTSVQKTYSEFTKDSKVVIGKPVNNTQLYITDGNLKLTPIGVPGELCIAGDGLARGYFKRPELTTEKFIENPFSDDPTSRLYKTGDLVRYLPDGNIEFIGRIDNQVKVRGFRIELGEIESALNKIETIKACVVVAKDDSDGNKRLVAYIVSGTELNIEEIRERLAMFLPDYMVPSLFVRLETLPLTPNGKIDRKALIKLEGKIETTNEYLSPRNETEQKLVAIWSQVLGVEKVGVYDNFFELGGHSLLATQVISQIRAEFNIELPLKSIFEKPVLVNLSELIETTKPEKKIPKITACSRDTNLPLSFAQERLWFMDQFEHNSIYYMPKAVKLIGKLDIVVLEKTFTEIIRRHEVLRTNFVTINNVANQLIHKESTFKLQTIDYSHLSEEAANKKIRESIEIESQKSFDLANDSLIRLVLYKIKDQEHTLFLNKHHIISDGWSTSVFIKEVSILYKAFSENKPSPLPELEIQYADYAVWQREHIKGEVLTRQSEYWNNKLTGVPILELPTDRPRPAEQTFNGDNLHFYIREDLSKKLYDFSKENDVTLFMTLLSAFKVLLNKYTGQDDICVGSPIANRTRSEIEPLIGFFVNTLALRSDLSGDINFMELIEQVKQTTLDAYDNQDIPFEKVVDIVQPERNLSHSPLFQVMLLLQNNPESYLSFGELVLKPVEFDQRVSKAELRINFTETAKGIIGVIEYNTDLFDRDRIERMAGHFSILLESILSNPNVNISELEILAPAEKHQLLIDWNNTKTDYLKDKCIPQLFKEQVEKTPDKIALYFEGRSITYGELNERSNQLAHLLVDYGITSESFVTVFLERSIDYIISILGIIKVGAAYIPIDSNNPTERINYILEDSNSSLIITKTDHVSLLSTSKLEISCIDMNTIDYENYSAQDLNVNTSVNDPLYVLYTSGSTGKPKGVVGIHKGLINRIHWNWTVFPFERNEMCCQITSISFVRHVAEVFTPLLKGVPMHIFSEYDVKDTSHLVSKLIENKISRITFAPSLLRAILESEGKNSFDYLKYVVCSGEALPLKLVKDFYRETNNTVLVNLYGSSEVSSDVTFSQVEKNHGENELQVPIGKPLSNTEAYIVDSNNNILPVGIPGELCVSGDGLARGYLKRPELTAEKFIKHPFNDNPGSRLFKTGDLAKYLPDGNIEFIGRIDNQVKIRGFRIELGEIESVLNEIEIINDCVVIAKEDTEGNKSLVAFIVSDNELNIQEIRENLAKLLPDYMIPSLFVRMEKLPLTPNGKIDKKALPEPNNNIETTHKYVAPRNETEQKLAAIWSKVLRIEKVGIYDNFFELGGHSLLATQLISQIRTDFNNELPLKVLFENSTIVALSKKIDSNKFNTEVEIMVKAEKRNVGQQVFENDLVGDSESNIEEFNI